MPVNGGENGLLVDFFSPQRIAARVDEALSMDSTLIRQRARAAVIANYDLKRVCLPKQLHLVGWLTASQEKLNRGQGGVRIQNVDALQPNA